MNSIPIELEDNELIFNETTGAWEDDFGKITFNVTPNKKIQSSKQDTPIVIPDYIPIVNVGGSQYISINAAASILNLSFQRVYFKIKKYNIPCLQNNFIPSKLINIKHLNQFK